jgi:predicted O-methyltransferase YrrM
MEIVHIREQLRQLGHEVESFALGDFDRIGEYTARRERSPQSEGYRKHGCFYRPNYERGLLIYALIQSHQLTSYLEVGFGRGYSSICAAKAFTEAGIAGRIVTVDPMLDRAHLERLQQIFPNEWLEKITFMEGTSEAVLPGVQDMFDLVYIDGDHHYAQTRFDWEWARDHYRRFVLFDDYHLAKGDNPDIECARAIDEISGVSKQLIVMDRRLFIDDRGIPDADIHYGQVLVTHPQVADPGL